MIKDMFLYIDPGTANALLACIIGALAGGGMYLKTKWHSIKYRNKTKK